MNRSHDYATVEVYVKATMKQALIETLMMALKGGSLHKCTIEYLKIYLMWLQMFSVDLPFPTRNT